MSVKSTAAAAILIGSMASAPQALAEEFRLCSTTQDGKSLTATFVTKDDATATREDIQEFFDRAFGDYVFEELRGSHAEIWADKYKELGLEEKGVEFYAKDPVFSENGCG